MGIFQCKGNSVQRPSYLTASQGRIRFPCPFPGLLDIHRDNGIQGGIVPGNLPGALPAPLWPKLRQYE
jgi:hypothetical protein